MLLKQKILDAIAGGRVSLVFRRWPRPVLAAGDLMPSPLGPLRVADAGMVEAAGLTPDDARAAGFADVPALLASLGEGDEPIYRVHLRLADEGEGVEIGPTAIKALRRRLDRHDRADGTPWTRPLLDALAAAPGCPASDLAATVGRPLPELRRALARLVDMGLVDAAGKGYALSPRGIAFVAAEKP
ncbi:helix-turn-helix domain-containing protein [Zavarzinia aquatilis]|uniref:HTH iclR-type domain-containing protein n=1 Tax=Zavarzinia aquatilis TaxID=2211142 RepID=A0A317E364_9PROT|nr:helix-turn-helix domain-containing protein [Zavarzinia aquatilis]PWR21487.1 hypothetical protein DKG74_13750 [Zavarzinia aquatilis]